MTFKDLTSALATSHAATLSFQFDTGQAIAPHFHVTEVGLVTKDFVDCGGVRRSEQTCVLQTLVADDVHHRLSPTKLLSILQKSTGLGISGRTPVEVETQGRTIETYTLAGGHESNGVLTFDLESTSTACLAPDKCGIPSLQLVGQPCCAGGVC